MKYLLLALALVCTACSSDTQGLNLVEPDPTVQPVDPMGVPEPVAQPIAQPEPEVLPLEMPEVQGTVDTFQTWRTPKVGLPEPYVLILYTLWWSADADGYDILIDGEYVESVTRSGPYEFTREHYGLLEQVQISEVLPEVRIRAWRDDQETVSDPVMWIY